MRPKSLLVLAVLALGACSSGDDEGSTTPTTARAAGCPVAPDVVIDAVGHHVRVERRTAGAGSCAYLGNGGARVEVALRSLDDRGFPEVLADVERRAGGTIVLPDDLVEGAERGWIAEAGRAVQVGAAAGDRLAIVAVVDPALDLDTAREVAADLAGEALST